MTCEAEGVPVPDIIWTRNDITISPLKSRPGFREIKITPKDVNDFGDYVCTAKNFLGLTQQIFTIEEIGKLSLQPEGDTFDTMVECQCREISKQK